MAISTMTGAFIQIATATTGGTAPGGATAPTGCTLSSPVDISAYVYQVESGVDIAMQEVTTMGAGGWANQVNGLRSALCNLQLYNDYAASALNALVGMNGTICNEATGNATFFIEVRPANAARSATNAGFIAKVISPGWRQINASVGQAPTVAWNLVVTGFPGELTA